MPFLVTVYRTQFLMLLTKGMSRVDRIQAIYKGKIGKPDLTDEEIDAAWNSLLLGVDEGTHEILAELK